MSLKGLFNVFRMHIQSMFDEVSKETLREGVSPLWKHGMTTFIDSKLAEYFKYQEEIQCIINETKSQDSVGLTRHHE